MTAPTNRDFLTALQELPPSARAWLEADDPLLWAFYGLGVLLNEAQEKLIRDVLFNWPSGTIHRARWANRAGKTTGVTILEMWAVWRKWRFQASGLNDWLGYTYRWLHAAPQNRLMGKAWDVAETIIAGTSEVQRDKITGQKNPAPLAPFFTAGRGTDVSGAEILFVKCANGGVIDYLSTHDGAGRLESENWWGATWDEYGRQQPVEDVPLLLDQTFLPRTSDFMGPIILSGTSTEDSEVIDMELEERAAEEPTRWNISVAARDVNFTQTRESIERQVALSVDADVATRSTTGEFGAGGGKLFPHFVIDNAFTDLPERMTKDQIVALELRRAQKYICWSMFDHALRGDDNVTMTWAVPFPYSLVTPENPILGVSLRFLRSSRVLTPAEQQRMIEQEYAAYKPEAVIIDSTAEGGLGVYRTARASLLPVVPYGFGERSSKVGPGVSKKDAGIQALQKMLAWGLDTETGDDGLVEAWPEPDGLFGLVRLPKGGVWLKLRRQLAVLRRDDEKIRQDAAMCAVMGAGHLIKLIDVGGGRRIQPFALVRGTRR